MDDVTLSGLLSARLCHDLVNPVGAARNGLEMLAEESDPAIQREAQQLTADSLADALARLKYLRLAFGTESPGHRMPEARAVAMDLLRRGKVRLDWPAVDGGEPRPAVVRLGLNLILVAAEALPRGGTLAVDWTGDRVALTAQGDRAVLKPEVEAALTGKGNEAEAKLAPAFLAAALAARLGASIAAEADEDSVRIACPVPSGR